MCDYHSIGSLWFYSIPNLQISSTFYYVLLMISGRLQLIPAKILMEVPAGQFCSPLKLPLAASSEAASTDSFLLTLLPSPTPSISSTNLPRCLPRKRSLVVNKGWWVSEGSVLAAPRSHLANQNIHPTRRDRSPVGILLTFPPHLL